MLIVVIFHYQNTITKNNLNILQKLLEKKPMKPDFE